MLRQIHWPSLVGGLIVIMLTSVAGLLVVTPASAPAQTAPLWMFGVYLGAVLVTVGGMLGLSYILGQRHEDRETNLPYESGVAATGSARVRLSAKFYLVAMLFVIFDLEAVFIIAWAIAFREVGWIGYLGILFFIGVLVATLVYEWQQGALDWGPQPVAAGQLEKERE